MNGRKAEISGPGALECDVHILDDSGQPDESRNDRLLGIPGQVLHIEDKGGLWDLSIRLTTDDQLRAVHATYLDDDTETDVMSFLYGEQEFEDPVTFGEIVISVDRAADQAIAANWTLEQELTFLLVHGMLHLCGWVDDTESARDAMHARQHEIIELLEQP